MLPDSGQRIGERGMRRVVPGGRLDGNLPTGVQRMGQQCHHRVEAEQTRGGALDCTIRPLSWRFDPAMSSALLKGGFDGPALDERLDKRTWPIAGTG
jgi:hypothetical protein